MLKSECAVGDVVLMGRPCSGGLFNIIRITSFGARGGRVAGLVLGGNSAMVGKVRLFEPAWYVQKLDQARFQND